MQAVLARGVPFRFRALGWSMSPFIRDGDIITVAPMAGRTPAMGDVVAFVHPQTHRLVVHRVIGRRGAVYWIQGDNTAGCSDGLVGLPVILGWATQATYEAVTRKPGSYAQFRRGLNLLLDNGIKVRLKATAIRSNVHELLDIARFCRQFTTDYFRFDPLLHLRYDGDAQRNAEIKEERLSPAEIVAIEQADAERAAGLQKGCNELIQSGAEHTTCAHLFHCGAGQGSFSVSYEGYFRLCSTLHDPQTLYDLCQGSLADAWSNIVPEVRNLHSTNQYFLENCRACPIVNLCLWCPANAHLETGAMDGWIDYFCQVAHARAAAIQSQAGLPG